MLAKIQTPFVLMIMLALVVSAGGCGPKPVSLDAGDNGGQVELSAGQRLTVSLPGNPSTGYTWEVGEGTGGVLLPVGEAGFVSDDPNLVGAGGTLTLTFEAAQAGTTTLVLVYHRPWETDVEPLDTFTVTVTVR